MNISDPDDPAVLQAISRICDQCRAPVGELCFKRGGYTKDLLGRVIHIGRILER